MSKKLLRLTLMKIASLLAGDPFTQREFFTKDHANLILSVIESHGKDDPSCCQYSLWILTQFSSTPVFQHQIANFQGVEIFLRCMTDYWPTNPQVLLRGSIALYACIRMNTGLHEDHVEAIAPVIIKVMRQYPDHAKINLFGCWLLYEFMSCPKGIELLANPDTITDVQAILTRFYNDEVVGLAASLVLDSLTQVVVDCKEPLRLGVARGGLS